MTWTLNLRKSCSSDEQRRTRRARSIAIALALGALVILFYVVTLVKGPAVLEPAIVIERGVR